MRAAPALRVHEGRLRIFVPSPVEFAVALSHPLVARGAPDVLRDASALMPRLRNLRVQFQRLVSREQARVRCVGAGGGLDASRESLYTCSAVAEEDVLDSRDTPLAEPLYQVQIAAAPELPQECHVGSGDVIEVDSELPQRALPFHFRVKSREVEHPLEHLLRATT